MAALVWQQCYVLAWQQWCIIVWQQWYIIVWQQWACYERLVLCAHALGAGYVSVGEERAVASKPCLSDKKVNAVRLHATQLASTSKYALVSLAHTCVEWPFH